ncbi:hypothetical protein QN277_007393 [Acacia crassicarpa]|uniref:Uncharacterized protein n=1 Tax=Acacia crassicarpa TaxID=499986 RepID=A0AAE1MAF5_9FABA|nr:hypothetical protein QN277_007393 [Acacia crassicarpa]
MASKILIFIVVFLTSFFLPLFVPNSYSSQIIVSAATDFTDNDLIEFALNLEYLEAEFFLIGSSGYGLDVVSPDLAQGGPSPIGGTLAQLDPLTKDIIFQFLIVLPDFSLGPYRFFPPFY